MTAVYSLKPVNELSESETAGLREMKEAVYPPEEFARHPGRAREWLPPEWGVLVSVGGRIVSYTGIVATGGDVDERAARIGGVGSIATDPRHRGQGYAGRSIDMAIEWLERQRAAFALLVCRDELVPYYSALGWRLFEGDLRVTQFGVPETFVFNRVMVRDVVDEAPKGGVIDLHGPPW